jgi:hypothetical protein
LSQCFVNGIQIATWVDHSSLTGPTANDDRTVLRKGRYRDDREAQLGDLGRGVSSH